MAVAASINTNFTATTGNLEKNTKRAEGVVRGFGSRVRGLTSLSLPSIQQVIGASIITAIAKKAFDAFKSQFDEFGEIVDQSANLGVSGQQLRELHFAAKIAGVSAEQFDTALAKMADTIATAASGNEAAQKTFAALSLDAKKLVDLSPDQQIRSVADAFTKLGNSAKKIQLARDIGGRGGTALINMMQEGAAGIDAQAASFRRLGGALSEFDIHIADQAGDALDRAGVAFDNLGKQLAVNAAPGVSLFANSLAHTVGASAEAVRGQFALSAAYLEVNAWIADFIQWVAELTGLAIPGPQKASEILFEDWRRILRLADEAARRAAELRGGAAGVDATTGRKRVEPAAVERGTAKFIEAVNKASGARGGGDIQKKMLKVDEDQLGVLKDIKRGQDRAAQAIGQFAPANLEP